LAEAGIMRYVYLIRSISNPEQTYVGITDDLKRRLRDHSSGDSPHTSKFRPWHLVAAVTFNGVAKAAAFEQYLKSGSGALSRQSTSGDGVRGLCVGNRFASPE
jgi:predicted GIY-YIG superfamily endonuclease